MWRTREFWDDTVERTGSSAVQGFIAGAGLEIGGVWVSQIDLTTLPWQGAVLGAGGMALLTFLKCLYAATRGDQESASLRKNECDSAGG